MKSDKYDKVIILVLDCSAASCAVCLWKDEKILAFAHETMERGQDARLMPMIVSILEQCDCTFSKIDRIAVTKGPGSFTGVRVGLAAGKGLGLAAQKPVLGIDRFLLYSTLYQDSGCNLLIVLASKRAELFCKYFPKTGPSHEPSLMTEQEIASFCTLNSYTKIIRDDDAEPKQVLGMGAHLASQADLKDLSFEPRPLYLRAPDVTFAKAR